MKLSAILAPLIAAGVSGDVILATVKAFEEQQSSDIKTMSDADEDRRAKGRERWRRWKESKGANVSKREQTSANNSCAGDTRGDVKQINIDTSKEERKDKSAAKPLSDLAGFKAELQQILSPERVEAIVDLRRKKKAPLTIHAGRLLVKALSACPDIAAAADEMVIRNWTGIKPEWLSNRETHPPPSQAPPKKSPFQQRQDDIYQQLKRETGDRDDEFTGTTLDLGARDFRAH